MFTDFKIISPDEYKPREFPKDYSPERVYPLVALPPTITLIDLDNLKFWTKGFFWQDVEDNFGEGASFGELEPALIDGKYFKIASFVVKPEYFEDFKKKLLQLCGHFVEGIHK